LARVLPFVLFVLLTSVQGSFGEASRYWLYAAKSLLAGWMLWALRHAIREMRWAFSWEAVAAGVLVFLLWVGLDSLYPSLDRLLSWIGLSDGEPDDASPWNPLVQFPDSAAAAWFFRRLKRETVSAEDDNDLASFRL